LASASVSATTIATASPTKWARRHLHRRTVAVLERDHARHVADAGGLQIGAGHDGEHAGGRLGLRHVDGREAGMRVGRAHEIGLGLALDLDVVRVAAVPRQKTRIFDPLHRLPDAELDHG
jgi:hypothetical protein